jgi:hypothetical protein
VTQVFVALVWLGASTYAAHATLTGAFAAAAAALPGVIAAALVAGASIGAAAGPRLRSAGARLLGGLALATLFGLAAAAAIRFAYGGEAAILTLAITIGAASAVGGTLAVLPAQVLRTGLWGTIWVFLAGVVFGVSQPHLVKLLGSGAAANSRFVVGQAVLTGLVAAYCALRLLRVRGLQVLWYLVAGGLPGLVELCDATERRHALIVLAVGGLVAMLTGTMRSLPRRRRRQSTVDAFHRRLARAGLVAGEPYGFALAGAYAVQAAGFLKRPSDDLDLFTAWERRADFDTGARAIIDAYLAAGLNVVAERGHDTFIRLTVSDGPQTAKVELGVDVRANEPVRNSVGPVLHPDDALANKMRALCERCHAGDYIDIDAVLRSGRYDRSRLLQLAERSDITFNPVVFADSLAQAELLDADDFAHYGVVGQDLERLRRRLADWRTELLETARTD